MNSYLRRSERSSGLTDSDGREYYMVKLQAAILKL